MTGESSHSARSHKKYDWRRSPEKWIEREGAISCPAASPCVFFYQAVHEKLSDINCRPQNRRVVSVESVTAKLRRILKLRRAARTKTRIARIVIDLKTWKNGFKWSTSRCVRNTKKDDSKKIGSFRKVTKTRKLCRLRAANSPGDRVRLAGLRTLSPITQ